MENLNIIHQSDNINIKYKKKIEIELLSTDKKSHLNITIDLCKTPFYNLGINSKYEDESSYDIISCSFYENYSVKIVFNYFGQTLILSEDKAQCFVEIYERLKLFSKFHALRNLEFLSLIDKAFEIADPKLREMINEFIEYFYLEEKQNNLTRTLKKEE